MGRKRKFGEESDFVSVRVPKSKRKEYRIEIKNFVEKKFASECATEEHISKIKINKIELSEYRKFEEFLEDIRKSDKD